MFDSPRFITCYLLMFIIVMVVVADTVGGAALGATHGAEVDPHEGDEGLILGHVPALPGPPGTSGLVPVPIPQNLVLFLLVVLSPQLEMVPTHQMFVKREVPHLTREAPLLAAEDRVPLLLGVAMKTSY